MAQTYENKELIIIYESHDLLTKEFIAKLEKKHHVLIKEVDYSPANTLGMLRNIALDIANGAYFCQWDDDDWFHESRLQNQLDFITRSGLKASILMQWIVYDFQSKKAYLSNKRTWEGSLMSEIDIVKSKGYDHKRLGEDTPVIDFLSNEGQLYFIDEMPYLYIYHYHGNNSWNHTHWQHIVASGTELSKSLSTIATKIMADKSDCSAMSKDIVNSYNECAIQLNARYFVSNTSIGG